MFNQLKERKEENTACIGPGWTNGYYLFPYPYKWGLINYIKPTVLENFHQNQVLINSKPAPEEMRCVARVRLA
jgi:hypothetical protein